MTLYLLDNLFLPSFLCYRMVLQVIHKTITYFSNRSPVFQSQFDDTYLSNDRIKIPNMIKRLLSRRKDRKREGAGAGGRRFKLDIKNRFVMILVYYNYTNLYLD